MIFGIESKWCQMHHDLNVVEHLQLFNNVLSEKAHYSDQLMIIIIWTHSSVDTLVHLILFCRADRTARWRTPSISPPTRKVRKFFLNNYKKNQWQCCLQFQGRSSSWGGSSILTRKIERGRLSRRSLQAWLLARMSGALILYLKSLFISIFFSNCPHNYCQRKFQPSYTFVKMLSFSFH